MTFEHDQRFLEVAQVVVVNAVIYVRKNIVIIFASFHIHHMWLTTAATSVMIYIASVHRKRFVYIISLNHPKVYSG